MALEKIAPPNLPLSPASGLTAHFFEQFSNILRLYFNRLTGSLNDLLAREEAFVVPISDQLTALTTGQKMTWRIPYAFTLTAIRASVNTAQASGSILTFDVKASGTTVFSTKVSIDNTEKTSTTAATPSVLSDTALDDDEELTFFIDQCDGATAAKGAVITLIGYQ